MKAAALVIQRNVRGFLQKRRYQKMRTGYMRLQAMIRSRVLAHRFKHLRGHVVGLQVCFINTSVFQHIETLNDWRFTNEIIVVFLNRLYVEVTWLDVKSDAVFGLSLKSNLM